MKMFLLIILVWWSSFIKAPTYIFPIDKLFGKVSLNTLYEKIVESNVKFPDIVFAQAILESGYFTSQLFKTTNNLFGMKYPKIRKNFAIGKSKSGYAVYSHWTKSVDDYIEWQKRTIKSNLNISRSGYLQKLSKIYCTDPSYISKINQITKLFNNYEKT